MHGDIFMYTYESRIAPALRLVKFSYKFYVYVYTFRYVSFHREVTISNLRANV